MRLALFVLGVIAVAGIISMVSLSGGPVGNVSRTSTVLVQGPLQWDKAFGMAGSIEEAVKWCSHNRISQGGFLDVLQREGMKQFRCFVVPPEVIPQEYREKYDHLKKEHPEKAPVVCFFVLENRPSGFDYPLVCDTGDLYKHYYDK